MAKMPEMSAAQVTIVLNSLAAQEAILQRAKKVNIDDADMVAVYDKRIGELAVVRGFFQGVLA